jgi:hypothetical protein
MARRRRNRQQRPNSFIGNLEHAMNEAERVTDDIYGGDDADFEDPDNMYYEMEKIWYDVDGPIVKLIGAFAGLFLVLDYAQEATEANNLAAVVGAFILATSFLIFSGAMDMWKRRPQNRLPGFILPVLMIVLAVYKSVNTIV